MGTLAALMLEEQAALHNMVRVTVDGWFAERERPDAVRQTRRSGWIDHALAPVEASLPPGQLRRLRFALALVMGAQALIVTRDVWRLEPEEATEVMRFAAATLIRGALDARAGPSLSRGRRPGAGEKAP
ncbi:MAG TPA: hypothetical protein VE152_00495 [Acidimicrobiales bacterium]|nr:hypothetical protein [Acidimicrobiales bacterium]